MRRIGSAIKRFFFPPADSPRWIRILPFAFMGILTIGAIGGSIYGWTYAGTSEFCGTTCHTMPPEYSAYLRSPHARVACVECHIGRDVVTTQFTRKAGDMRHVILTLTNKYEFPIFSRAMRPARDSCEKCHFPEKFSDDSLREVRSYGNDKVNTPENIFLVLKTGGGSKREGLGRGIHWHIENQIRYLATDELEQDIPYVRVTDEEGNVTEYYDIASGLTPDDVAGQTLGTMDCINCHNRITHSIPDPESAVDTAISKALISADLPFVREQGVMLLSEDYANQEEAFKAFEGLNDYYAQNYPEIHGEAQEDIQQAIATLEDAYVQSVFPEQLLDWTTHPDNLGHKNDPGCFRCHDGKHLTSTGDAIRLECNLCHSVPVVADSNSLVTEIEVVRGPEPPSHTHSSWITLHGGAIDSSCEACHEPADPEIDYLELTGKPPSDGSFCGNSACHDQEWVYSGFDSPELVPYLERQLYALRNVSPYLLDGVPKSYEATFQTMFEGRCGFCHGAPEFQAELDLGSYEGLLTGGKNGPVIIPGDPDNSLIIKRQTAERDHYGQMLDDELEAVRAWIAAGAPES